MRLDEATILLVDDEPILGEIMVAWLKRVASQVFYAENGMEALRVLEKNPVDVVVSDIRMPAMDGIALLKKTKALRATPPVFIFVTGYSDLSLRDAYDMGADAILEKPIRRKEYLELIQRALTRTEELWKEPGTPSPSAKVTATFGSLAAAQETGQIAFGRRGFCIRSQARLVENPVEFTLNFKADQKKMSGQGIVRWITPDDGQYGIEITYLDDSSREWLIQFLKQNDPVCFIPGSTGTHEAQLRVA